MNQKQVGFFQVIFGILALVNACFSIFDVGTWYLNAQWSSVDVLWLYFGLFALITGLYDLKSERTVSKKK